MRIFRGPLFLLIAALVVCEVLIPDFEIRAYEEMAEQPELQAAFNWFEEPVSKPAETAGASFATSNAQSSFQKLSVVAIQVPADRTEIQNTRSAIVLHPLTSVALHLHLRVLRI